MSFKCALAAAALIVFPLKGYCWGALGHQIIGVIADERMTLEGKAFVAGILGVESAAIAADWADQVRSDDRFAHGAEEHDRDKTDLDNNNFLDYHFVDVPSLTTYDTRPNKDLKDSYGAIVGAIKILRDTSGKAGRTEKMIALRYLVHLVGDIHQPLHVGNAHDIGGNFCLAFWKKGTNTRSLHQYWDGDLVTEFGQTLKDSSDPKSQAPFYFDAYLESLKNLRHDKLYAAKPKDVSANAIKSWVNETAEIRENKAGRPVGVYPEKPGQLKDFPGEEYKHRPYCMWFADVRKGVWGDTSPRNKKDIPQDVIPRLDDNYVQTNVKIVERQLITAGIRLAAIIDDIAQDVSSQELLSTEQQNAILKTIQDIFRNK